MTNDRSKVMVKTWPFRLDELERTCHRCFLKSFSSLAIGEAVSKEKDFLKISQVVMLSSDFKEISKL